MLVMPAHKAPGGLGASLLVAILMVATLQSSGITAPDLKEDRERGVRILRNIKESLRLWYYDPQFGGRDLDTLFASSEERIRTADSEVHVSGALALALTALNDSHTYFIPPPLAYDVDYGFDMRMIGDTCFIVAVKPGSLAEADGLRPGMAARTIEGLVPTRESLVMIRYALNAVRPRKELRLVVEEPGNAPRTLTVRAHVGPARPYQEILNWAMELEDRLRGRTADDVRSVVLSDRVTVAQLPSFMVPEEQTDTVFKAAHGREAFILDLRNNGGGSLNLLKRVAGSFLDDGTSIGEMKERKRTRLVRADRVPENRRFQGKLIVLVDSGTGSASEVLARELQLHKRATIVGDRTAGAVMVSGHHSYREGHPMRFIMYGLSISEAVLVMSDGGNLEGKGVNPDEIVLPSAEHLTTQRDPALARAAQLAGVELSPEAAGKLFPRVWE